MMFEQVTKYDSTTEFSNLCTQLNPGDLCHIKSFDLQDVMTAIELMDPKMDSRMKIHRKVIYLKEALEKKLLPLEEEMDTKILLGIIDETLACFVNWLKGDTLGQTVFINMYMHCTELITNKPLRGFCEAMKNIILFIKFVIFKASVAEEEDFYPTTSKMPLDDCMVDSKVTGMLKEVDDEISKSLKGKSNSSEEHLLTCLQYRLRFIRNFLLWSIVVRKHLDCVNNKLCHETYQECSRFLGIMQDMIIKMIETVDVGQPAGEGKTKPQEEVYGLVGFEPYLNQPLLPPAIPRCADIEERLPALNYLKELLARFQYIHLVFKTDLTVNIIFAWDFLKQFGTYGCEGSVKSCALTRSLILTFYLTQFNFPANSDISNTQSNNIKIEMFKSSLQYFNRLTSWSEIESAIKIDEKLLIFLGACAENIFQIPFTYSLNRSRQRTRLELIIEANWELYEECTKVDHLLRSYINQKNNNSKRIKDIPPLFSSFVAVIQFRTMMDYIISGFELDLYAPHELMAVYFILSENVLKYFESHYREIESSQQKEQSRLPKVANKKTRKALDKDISINLNSIRNQISKISVYHELASAFFVLVCALTKDNRIGNMDAASSKYSSAEICYLKRFSSLVSRGWFYESASFFTFKDVVKSYEEQDISLLYEKAANKFDMARKNIDALSPDLFTESSATQLSTIAKNNWIVSRLLSKKSKPGPIIFNFDESTEKAFPLVKLR